MLPSGTQLPSPLPPLLCLDLPCSPSLSSGMGKMGKGGKVIGEPW